MCSYYQCLCSVSCLGESCTDVDDCKGTAPSVNCIGGTCKCAVGYSATIEGVCLQGEYFTVSLFGVETRFIVTQIGLIIQ